MKPLQILSLLCLLVACQVHAQNRTLRVVFLDRPADAPKSLYLFDGKKSQLIELPKLNLSKIYHIDNASTSLSLTSAKIHSKKSLPSGSPTSQIPAAAKELYLVITSHPENTTNPMKLHLVGTGAQPLQQGEMLFYNLFKRTIEGNIQNHKVQLAPNQQQRIHQAAKTKGSISVQLSFLYRQGKKRSICNTQWSYTPTQRSIGIIYDTPGKLTPTVQNFLDYRAPKKK